MARLAAGRGWPGVTAANKEQRVSKLRGGRGGIGWARLAIRTAHLELISVRSRKLLRERLITCSPYCSQCHVVPLRSAVDKGIQKYRDDSRKDYKQTRRTIMEKSPLVQVTTRMVDVTAGRIIALWQGYVDTCGNEAECVEGSRCQHKGETLGYRSGCVEFESLMDKARLRHIGSGFFMWEGGKT
ncbi:hypothetical protein RRG08_005698 [Elysia crispata]|uniref:Uncharacterized protein n=1 Tax=Elysia crispata TaxID=231223 RepID=A0AAE0YCV1_9GAST|nr:hypothetical protein RRG08_005698 [Elysia crispata]